MARGHIGLRIKRQREARGLSQLALARKARVAQSYVSQLEAGERKAPGIYVVQRLAKALGVSLAELLE